MKFDIRFVGTILALFPCLAIYTSSMSLPSSTQSSSPVETTASRCELVEMKPCSKLHSSAQLPNLYGHTSTKLAGEKVNEIVRSFSKESNAFVTFICTLYLPPCSINISSETNLTRNSFAISQLPCRRMCETAATDVRQFLTGSEEPSWPIKCHTLPTENCFNLLGPNSVAFVKTSISATPTRTSYNNIADFAPLEVELGNDEGYEVEVVSLSSNRIPERRYDIANLGDPELFHGWTDVQGTGAANDYCRVIGKGKRRFLSCNLAGSTGQGHHYVSKLGFEAGYTGTWFMRDMDGDGRDDYCRCVGSKNISRITCMKAGEHGFYGSITQGGDQHTFSLPSSQGCSDKRLNPMFGEIIV